MEQTNNPMALLETNTNPVFCVQNRSVIYTNAAAKTRGVEIGTNINDLLTTGKQEYAQFSGQCLYLCLELCGSTCAASVSREGDFDVFVLETDEDEKALQALALAARELRAPLASIMTVSQRFFCEDDAEKTEEDRDQIRHMNKGMYQLLRIISNMSDASRYTRFRAPSEAIEIAAFFDEVMEKGAALAQQAKVNLKYTGMAQPAFAVVNPEQLERAVYNLLSNALKHSPEDGTVCVKLRKKDDMLYLTVQDQGQGIPTDLRSSVFKRYHREPGVEDGLNGIGLGMVLVKAAAAAHGGTVLMEQLPEGGLRVTVTLRLTQDNNGAVRSPAHRVDYLGELDHALVELSDALPAEAFQDIN